MIRRVVAAAGAGLAGLAVVGVGVWWWNIQQDGAARNATPVRSQGGSIALDTSGTQGAQGVNLSGGSDKGGSASAKSVLDLDKGSQGSASGAGQTAAPSSEELARYEKYKESQEVMFGDLAKGTGAEVKAGSKVVVNYRGWLTDGKLFDDSYAKGQALAFTVGEHRVISGFEAGLVGMKSGGRRRIIVPPAGGYGDQANGGIPAKAVLVFDVEVVQVQ
ncbi:MAG: fkpA [Patescibacteria group bacterium]|nr:fkpA [Patescibacteria group bacterium]